MYSKEDKERLIADWRESGMPLATWCRDPTRPARMTVRRWLALEAEGLLEVPEREVRGRTGRTKHSRYPEETKREAVRLVEGGMRPADAARRLGVSRGALVSGWARAAARAKMVGDASETGKGGRVGKAKAASGATRAELEGRLAAAEAELEEALMQVDVLKELMRDPKAGDPASLSNRQKTELGERLRRDCGRSLREVLDFLSISKSTYLHNRARLAERAARAEAVAARVRQAFEASGGTYGYRRVRAAMASGADGGEPFEASEREVREAMRAEGLVPCRRRAERRWSSYAGESGERPANLPRERALERRAAGEDFRRAHDFSAPAPGELAVTDVTEFKVGGGSAPAAKVYLSPVLDCFDGLPAAWSASTRPDSELCDSSLEGYLAGAPEDSTPVIHTDGGSTYQAKSWVAICEAAGAVRSMSRKACCPDNARAEGFFGTLKREFYHQRDWSGATPEEFIRELGAYIEWYRSGRLKAFREGGKTVYDTIMGRRRRLGLAA